MKNNGKRYTADLKLILSGLFEKKAALCLVLPKILESMIRR